MRISLQCVLAGLLGTLTTGCLGSARVELAAAEALDAVADEVQVALDEFHGDLQHADVDRESAVIDAFVARVRRDIADEELLQNHRNQFAQALARLQADQRTAWKRYDGARDNLDVTRSVARDLRRLALANLALEQDARQYLETLLDQRQAQRARRIDGHTHTEETR